MDSLLPQNFQIQDPDSFFQIPPKQEPIDLEKSMEVLHETERQFKNMVDSLLSQNF